MSEINIDASIIEKEVSFNRSEEKFIEMSNGCICCTLREDLLIEVRELASKGKLIIWSLNRQKYRNPYLSLRHLLSQTKKVSVYRT